MTKEIYLQFRSVNDYGFRDQIQRTAVPVMNIIAEGFERRSDAEFRHFLFIAKGSRGEVRPILLLARELKLIEGKNIEKLLMNIEGISKMLSNFIKALS